MLIRTCPVITVKQKRYPYSFYTVDTAGGLTPISKYVELLDPGCKTQNVDKSIPINFKDFIHWTMVFLISIALIAILVKNINFENCCRKEEKDSPEDI
jgi:hypothetical protein